MAILKLRILFIKIYKNNKRVIHYVIKRHYKRNGRQEDIFSMHKIVQGLVSKNVQRISINQEEKDRAPNWKYVQNMWIGTWNRETFVADKYMKSCSANQGTEN